MLSLCGPEDVQKQTGWTDVAEYFLNRRLKNVVVTLGKKGVSTFPTSLRVAMLRPRRIVPYSTHPVQGAFPVALRPFHRSVRVFSLVGTNRGIPGDSFVVGTQPNTWHRSRRANGTLRLWCITGAKRQHVLLSIWAAYIVDPVVWADEVDIPRYSNETEKTRRQETLLTAQGPEPQIARPNPR
jgi:hypothetical protein